MAEGEGGLGSMFGMDEAMIRRGRVVVDLLCVGLVALFCIYSLLVPLFGIVVGAVLMNIGGSPTSKRMGKVCLVLGILSVALFFIFGMMSLLIGTLPLFHGLGEF